MRDDVGMERESPSMDPRYRPEFQRGYSGGAVPTPAVPTPAVPNKSAHEPPRVGPPPAARIDVESSAVADPPAIESDPAKLRRNPYFLMIPLAGVGSIVLGASSTVSQWITNFSTQSESSNTVQSRFSQGLIFAFSSPLITVGLATLFGFVFWLAVRRRP
jgi:hypothetical protein